ncbi:MAG TPA: GspE/PulE family protein [Candidatus Paceibacterota bacterium]
MPAHFDTDAENEKLAHLREREEEDLASVLSEKYGLPYIDLSAITIDMEALRTIPEAEAREAQAIAFDKAAKRLSVAVRDPNSPAVASLTARMSERGFSVKPFMASRMSIEKGLGRYAELSYASTSARGVLNVSQEDVSSLAGSLASVSALKSFLDQTVADKKTGETSRLLEGILAAAFQLRASDIHFEPEDSGVRLRLRIDGLLTDAYLFDTHTYQLIDSRLKILSGLKLNVRDRAQDGRFSVARGAMEIEIRVSLIPGNYGESYVLRILDPEANNISFDTLSIHPKLKARLAEEIKRPNGMLLTTGPTGSGKTTTLYAFLRAVSNPDIKIITIEDPIEYHLQGIVQTQVEGDTYTFAEGLRSIVRQDPDVILVGEIRDADTAGIAIQAALTGHFVFSTLHTNNAAGTFPRLVDLGVDPKSFASAVTVSMAQRLIRTLNPDERKQVPLTGEQKALVEKVLSTITDKSLLPASIEMTWVPDPKSPESNGYKGRTGVYEAIFMDEELGNLLRDNPSEGEIAKNVARQGFLTMAQDGVLKALAGVTSLEEVIANVDLPRD